MNFCTVLSAAFVLYEFQGMQYFGASALFGFSRLSGNIKKDKDLKTLEIIQKFDYPAEAHTVETQDGYFLTLHRIPYDKNSKTKFSRRRTPVLLQHGLFGNSVDFLLISTRDALPLLLSDLGFDVWMGNFRGNSYSRKHKEYLTSDIKFWNYTWHESAVYDTSTMIDFILDKTQAEKLIYIGYSLGTTVYFVLTSMLPEYNNKIEVALLMAPSAFAKNVKSPILRFLSPMSNLAVILSRVVSSGEFLMDSYIFHMFATYFCSLPFVDVLFCRNFLFLIYGADYDQFNPTVMPLLLNHFPDGYSSKAVNHYAQLIKSGKFQQYDYGAIENLKVYGKASPPPYDLSKIQVPTYFYVGKNDYLATLADSKETAKQLRTLRQLHVVDYPSFTHLDFIAAYDVKNLVYNHLINDMLDEMDNKQ